MSPHEGLDDIARFSEEHPKSHMIDIFDTKYWIKPFVNKIKNHVYPGDKEIVSGWSQSTHFKQ